MYVICDVGLRGGEKIRVVYRFLGTFLHNNCSDELKNNHARVFILYFEIFWGSRIGETGIVIIGIMLLAFFIYLVVLVVKEESSKKKKKDLKCAECVLTVCISFLLRIPVNAHNLLLKRSVIGPNRAGRIGSFETLSSFVNIVIFWYPFLLLIMLRSTHFPWFQNEGVWGFFCRFYIFIFYFWCIFNKLGFACHRAIAIKKVPRYSWLGTMFCVFSYQMFVIRHDATLLQDVLRPEIPI